MLNADALSELSKLKKIIEDSKDTGEGTVRGSQGRHGFVNLDDGRTVYLAPEEMQRVLPGDRVSVEVVGENKNKQEAKLQKLLEKNFQQFVGSYLVKGNNHFVVPSHKETTRGLFVPPRERKSHQDGDFVQCQLSRHPFADGKSQIKIVKSIGKPEDAGVEHEFIACKYQLDTNVHKAAEQQVHTLGQCNDAAPQEDREDFTHLPFATIDAEDTEDLDDALYAEKNVDGEHIGWTLYSAIADPSTLVAPDSPLDRAAVEKASSVYFPGQTHSMFPNQLAKETFSLLPQQIRPALLCKIDFDAEGKILNWVFINARIKSRAKLSYEQVATFLDGGVGIDEEDIRQNIQQLHALTQVRRAFRQQHFLVQSDNVDYRYTLNDKLQIESVQVLSNNAAHHMVEEAMVSTNCCAGEEFARNQVIGALYSTHGGFRTERLREIKHLLKLEKPDYDSEDIDTLTGFKRLMHSLDQDAEGEQLRWTLRRLLQAAEISNEAKAHFGLGFEHYALITSPIRRYQDLHNQRLIKNREWCINNGTELCRQLQQKIFDIRTAQRELDQRLLCRFLAKQVGGEFTAKITAISSRGLALRLVDTGAECFLPLRKSQNQTVKYDSVRLTLTVNDSCFKVEQRVKVILDRVHVARYQLQPRLCQDLQAAHNSANSEASA